VPISAPDWLTPRSRPARNPPLQGKAGGQHRAVHRVEDAVAVRPTSRIPAARAMPSTRSCKAAPSGPASASLPVMTMHAPTPAAAQSAICASSIAAGTARIATSTGPGAELTFGKAGRPRIAGRFGLIGSLRRPIRASEGSGSHGRRTCRHPPTRPPPPPIAARRCARPGSAAPPHSPPRPSPSAGCGGHARADPDRVKPPDRRRAGRRSRPRAGGAPPLPASRWKASPFAAARGGRPQDAAVPDGHAAVPGGARGARPAGPRPQPTASARNPSPQRASRAVDGEGKCAKHSRVRASQAHSSTRRRVFAARAGSKSARIDISG